MLRLWGCYSVSDHLEPRAFVADLLLYDRLVIPTPAPDDWNRWEKRWDPDRQARLLEILGPLAEPMEWSIELRGQLDDRYSPGAAAVDVSHAGDPYQATRMIITDQVMDRAVATGDVRGVAVYAEPDRFDREWTLGRSFPFVRRETVIQPGEVREAGDPLLAAQQDLARVIVTRLVVPDDGVSDEEVLKRTVELVSDDRVAQARAELQHLVGSIPPHLKPSTIAGEVDDVVTRLNEAVSRRTKRQRARVALQLASAGAGTVALWAPPVGIAAGPSTAVGEAIIERRWGAPTEAPAGAVELLGAARRALA